MTARLTAASAVTAMEVRLMDQILDKETADGPVVAAPASASHLAVADTMNCECGSSAVRAASDPRRRISSHRTTEGHVVYYRCECGRPKITVMRWTTDRPPATVATAHVLPEKLLSSGFGGDRLAEVAAEQSPDGVRRSWSTVW